MAWTVVKIFVLLFFIGSISSTKISKLVGGSSNVSITSFPFLVSIRKDGSHFCSGSIIGRMQHILTAAHCVWRQDKNELRIHSGTSRSDGTGNVNLVESIHIHPEYRSNDSALYDIAVITLQKRIESNIRQNTAIFPDLFDSYQTAYIVGWGGMANTREESFGRHLQKLKVALLPSDDCQSYTGTEIDKIRQVCSFRSGTKGLCAGDSGSPLVSAGRSIVAIVSRRDFSNCVDGLPDIHTNIQPYVMGILRRAYN